MSGECRVNTSRIRSSVCARSRIGYQCGEWRTPSAIRSGTEPDGHDHGEQQPRVRRDRCGRRRAARRPGSPTEPRRPAAPHRRWCSSSTQRRYGSRFRRRRRPSRTGRLVVRPAARARARRGARGTTRTTRRPSTRSSARGSHPSSSRAFVVSNHSDSPYSSQWYGANGARPSAASGLASPMRAGAFGQRPHPRAGARVVDERLRASRASCRTRWRRCCRRSGRAGRAARRQASARSSACTNW